MAHRVIAQIVFIGTRVLGHAFSEAYKQAAASQKYAAATAAKNPTGLSRSLVSAELSLDEACKILDVPLPKSGKVTLDTINTRYKKLFEQNDPQKGGSFYLQSKVYCARERINHELQQSSRQAAKT